MTYKKLVPRPIITTKEMNSTKLEFDLIKCREQNGYLSIYEIAGIITKVLGQEAKLLKKKL